MVLRVLDNYDIVGGTSEHLFLGRGVRNSRTRAQTLEVLRRDASIVVTLVRGLRLLAALSAVRCCLGDVD